MKRPHHDRGGGSGDDEERSGSGDDAEAGGGETVDDDADGDADGAATEDDDAAGAPRGVLRGAFAPDGGDFVGGGVERLSAFEGRPLGRDDGLGARLWGAELGLADGLGTP